MDVAVLGPKEKKINKAGSLSEGTRVVKRGSKGRKRDHNVYKSFHWCCQPRGTLGICQAVLCLKPQAVTDESLGVERDPYYGRRLSGDEQGHVSLKLRG